MVGYIVFLIFFVYVMLYVSVRGKRQQEKRRAAQHAEMDRQLAASFERARAEKEFDRKRELLARRADAATTSSEAAEQTRIAQRRKAQQADADRSRVHQSLHQKEAEEAAERADAEALARRAAEDAGHSIERFEFEDKDLMAEVYDLIACGYPDRLPFARDFIAEGEALLQGGLQVHA